MSTTFMKAAILFCFAAPSVMAQSDAYWEIRPMAGVAVPTGAHRSAFGTTSFVGAQTSIRLTTDVDLVGSFAWQPSTARYPADDGHANVFVYSFGLERMMRAHQSGTPGLISFAGAGLGGRAFDFHSSVLSSEACYSGYVNGGVGYERPRSTVRLEMRDHLFCYKRPVAPRDQTTHNELSLSLGFGVRF